ncbi:uncharacterized protein PGTG_20908 [Puccinia graminis f. sp. tritici CRL 75-36-700-3]|uniref:Uncharacterized protein n=1 Tax=Puccinia graminis f. sp. tritici (strain CRL 75-36-700-3 / race SCCL) TaxID=418459 RepID=H6QPV7_PUCGT|nr:uncharacterized protein PGTG_20908 [Puccinia graminis f. sp. tritici CRL 75-36-700-3]EHS64295.1 hypothetical protein PGTG_20908 [Puccinia graminis f. sp. tritici CRL 75-36-700-3]
MCGKGRLPPTIQPRLEELIDVEPDFVLLKSNANGKGYSKFGKPHLNQAENPESP